MKVILSIHPEFIEKIKSGEKRYEYRRKIFKKNVDSILVYVPYSIQKIVGEIFIDEILNDNVDALWEKTKDFSGITKEKYDSYFDGASKGYAIKIKEFVQYETPRSIRDYGVYFNPHNYTYARRLPEKGEEL